MFAALRRTAAPTARVRFFGHGCRTSSSLMSSTRKLIRSRLGQMDAIRILIGLRTRDHTKSTKNTKPERRRAAGVLDVKRDEAPVVTAPRAQRRDTL